MVYYRIQIKKICNTNTDKKITSKQIEKDTNGKL